MLLSVCPGFVVLVAISMAKGLLQSAQAFGRVREGGVSAPLKARMDLHKPIITRDWTQNPRCIRP